MPQTNYPNEFVLQLPSVSKQLNVGLEIDGLDYVFSLYPLFESATYGDPDLHYGDSGLIYGGLKLKSNSYAYISSNSSLSIAQRLEPEQGKASISNMSVVLIDKDGLVSRVVSPGGGILNEILGVGCTIRIGFTNTAYPGDYYVAFRGFINNVVTNAGKITLSIGDANQKRRSATFQVEKTVTTSSINSSTVTIPTEDASAFYQPILGPDGSYDSGVTLYAQIEDEVIQYSTSTGAQINAVSRGARGTSATSHAADTDITHSVQLYDHPLTMALKIMLSGWNGPYLTGVVPQAIGTTLTTPTASNAIVLPLNKSANIDYGLVIGDYVTVSGSTLGNNKTTYITSIEDLPGQVGVILRTADSFVLETSTSLALSFRSKYDTYPISIGLKLSPMDVDVRGHEELRDQFLSDGTYVMRPYINSQQVGKTFIESELYLPIGCYSLSRYGRLSVNQTRPPIATQTLQFLNSSNVKSPASITNTRGLNNRKFFNSIQFQYDLNDQGTFLSVERDFDSDSFNAIGIVSLLPIQSAGLKSDLGASSLVSKVSLRMLSRYGKAAYEIYLKTNFQVGARIEVGDIVVLQDEGYLQITNFDNGERNLGTQLYEVTDKTLDIKMGEVSLKLVSGITGTAADRYGTISPSSLVSSLVASTTTSIKIDSSYSPSTGSDETLKWRDYIGLPIVVRTYDFGVSGSAILQSADNSSIPYTITTTTALPFTPTAGMIVEIPSYPTSIATTDNQLYKIIHGFQDPTVTITSSSSATAFQVSSSDISKFLPDAVIYVRDSTFTNISPDIVIDSVDTGTNTVYLKSSMGFSPTAGFYSELIGFADGGAGYRII